MRFAYPWALAVLVPLAATAWWALTRGEKRRARFPYPGVEALARAALMRAWPIGRWGPAALRAAGLFLLILGLARPQTVTSRASALGSGIDIMLALDVSPSMAAQDLEPSRLEAAKATARRFILGRVQDRIGLVVFGGGSELSCPLTLDYDALLGQLDTMTPGMTGVDGTALGDGLVSAVNHLRAGEAKTKIVILLTDGRSNTGLVDPMTAAKAAASLGVKVYTIGTAGRGKAFVNYVDPQRGPVQGYITDDLDEELLAQIASTTEGQYRRATSVKELRETYDTIDRLEKSKITLPPVVSRDDLYRPFLFLGALFLLIEVAFSNTLWLRWP